MICTLRFAAIVLDMLQTSAFGISTWKYAKVQIYFFTYQNTFFTFDESPSNSFFFRQTNDVNVTRQTESQGSNICTSLLFLSGPSSPYLNFSSISQLSHRIIRKDSRETLMRMRLRRTYL